METTHTRRFTLIPGNRLRTALFCTAVVAGTIPAAAGLFTPEIAQAQPAETDARMIAGPGEKAGELGRGELLANSLKREKLDPNSIRQAMQSIGKLFDFRLSRAGDKYVYKAQNGRKIQMLRYQRGPHVYEAVLDEATGEYYSRLVAAPPRQVQPAAAAPAEPKVDFRAPSDEDDGEVDVEHVPMRGQNQIAEDAEHGAPDAPTQPEDDALAGKPSPDAEFEDHFEADILPGTPQPLDTSDDPTDAETDDNGELPEYVDDTRVANPVIAQPQAKNVIVPEPTVTNEPFTGSIRAKKPAEPENTTFTTIGYVTLILGSVFLLLAVLIYALPALRARRRVAGMGLKIRDIIRISAEQRLLFVECDDYTCLIAINRDSASFVAPCPLDEATFIQQVKAKSYWHQMSGKPLSDRQLASLVQALAHPKAERTTTAQMTVNDDIEDEDENGDTKHTPQSHAFAEAEDASDDEDAWDDEDEEDEDEDGEDEYEDDDDADEDEEDEDEEDTKHAK
ncbi:MAG: hypothetical protein IKY83_07655 [Proteobacteria bacterium]|nr:hypothetical protein [Pseudomonadota bacterium]